MKREVDIKKVVPTENRVPDEKYRKIRLSILDKMATKGSSLTVDDLDGTELDALDYLEKSATIVVQEGKINFAYPISGLATSHKVTLKDGRTFSAMCAIDALGACKTFGQDLTIDSVCSSTGDPIHIEIENDKIVKSSPSDIHAIHMELEGKDDWFASC